MTNLSSSVAPIEWAAFVAIDWADQKHYWALTRTASEKVEHGELDATPEGFLLAARGRRSWMQVTMGRSCHRSTRATASMI